MTFEAEPVTLPPLEPVWRALDAFWTQLQPLLPTRSTSTTTCKAQQCARLYPRTRKGARRHRAADLAQLLQDWERGKKITQNRWGTLTSGKGNAVATKAKALVEQFVTDVVEPFLVEWRAHLYALVVRALSEARDHYARDRRHRNCANYGDLLIEATRLVRDVPEVRAALQEKFTHVFVDEFQDTDPVQAELFLWLASARDLEGATSAWTAPLRRGALFIVGDPKQSIYRFRRADIVVYESVRQRLLATGGEVVSLTANFRSRPALCAFVNGACAEAFPAQATAEAPAYELLRPFRDEPTTPAAAVERLLVQGGVEGEARAVAELVRRELAARRHVASDYLVLTRTRTHLGLFATALQDARIPVEVSGASLFTSSTYVAALVDVLACLADPSDALALLRVLRGPLLGFTDEALFEFRRSGRRLELFGSGEATGEVADEIRRLQGWHQRVRTLPVGAALEVILDESGWLAHAAAHPGGGEGGALLQAVDRARCLAREGAGLREIASSLVDSEDVSTDIEALPLEPGRQDVVRVMNIHRAKGLEAKVVILADAKAWRDWHADVHVTRTDGRATGTLAIMRETEGWARTSLAQPRDWPLASSTEDAFLRAEVTRLQYVAATRARERLIVVEHPDPKDNKAWPLVRAALGGAPPVAWTVEPARVGAQSSLFDLMAAPGSDLATVRAARDAATAAARSSSSLVTSVTDEVRLSSSTLRAAHAGEDVDDPSQVLVPDSASHRADTGRHWGALIHGLLEQAMRAPSTSSADLARLARWLTVETPELRPHIPDAVALAERVASAPFWADARTHGEVHVEVPFTRVASPADRERLGMDPAGVPVLLRGVIDLVHRAKDGWRVVDYKTDQDRAQNLAAKYAAQVTVYAGAWSDASAPAGHAGVTAAVYAVRDGVLVEIRPPAAG